MIPDTKTRWATALGILSCALVWTACSPAASSDDDDDGIAVDDQAISDGKVERYFAATGLVDTNTGSFCSGVLIAPDVVLTAAHCALTDFGVTPPDAFYIGATGTALPMSTSDVPKTTKLKKYLVTDAISFGKIDDILTEDCPHATPDVVIFRLAHPVTGIRPAKIGAEPAIGAVCKVVGYGTHDVVKGTTSKTTHFQRRSAELTMTEVLPQALMLKRKTGISDLGDSGGPLFCDGDVVGLVSCGKDETMTTDDYYARLSTVQKKIDKAIAKWHPSP